MSEFIKYTSKDIEDLYRLFNEGKDPEEIAYELGRALDSVKYKMAAEGLSRSLTEKQMDQETIYADTIYNYWDSIGHDVNFKRSPFGYVRSSLKNGLPNENISPKVMWENGGRENFERIISHRKAVREEKNRSRKSSGVSPAPLVGWLDKFLEEK